MEFYKTCRDRRLDLNVNINTDPYELLQLLCKAWINQLKPFTEQIERVMKEVVK